MTTPATPRPRGPGESVADYVKYLDEFYAGAGAGTSNRTQAPPATATKITDDRYVEAGKGPNGTNVVWERQGDSWRTSYTSVGAPRTDGGGGTTNYRTANETRDALIARGGVPVGENTIYVRTGSTLDKYSRDTDGSYRPFGNVTNRTEIAQYIRAAQGRDPTAPTPQPGQAGTTGGAPPPLVFNPVTPSMAPTFESQRFASAVQPGLQMEREGTQTLRLGDALNRVAVANPYQGFSGYINKQEGQRAPGLAAMGTGPAVGSNLQLFPGGIGRGYTAPDRPFAPMSVTVPSTYNPATGMNDRGFFEPVLIGYNVTNANIDPARGPDTAGGMGTMLLAGPQTVHGINGLPGFNPFAAPESNIALAQGINLSGLDPARAAAATAAILDRQYLEDERLSAGEAGAAGGFGFGAGDELAFFAKGGRVMTAPPGMHMMPNGRLMRDAVMMMAGGGRAGTGPLGRPDLITNEPMMLVGMHSNQVKAIMGEDNGDRDRIPDREAIYLHGPNNSMMDVVPLELATGGSIATGGEGGNIPGGGGDIPPPPEVPPPPPIVDPTLPPPAPAPGPPPPPPYIPGPGSNPIPDYIPGPGLGFNENEFNAAIQPWQQLLQGLLRQQRLRDTVLAPRLRASGLARETGIPVLAGEIPAGNLPPGMFYDLRPQAERATNELFGLRGEQQALGPGEDVLPINERANFLGQRLDDFERMRSLQDARIAAAAGGNLQSFGAQIAYYQNLINSASPQLVGPGSPGYNSPANQQLQQQINQWQEQMNFLISVSDPSLGVNDRLAVIDAQLGLLATRTAGMNEASLQTELGSLRNRLSQQQQRENKARAVQNLAAIGVPKLGGFNGAAAA